MLTHAHAAAGFRSAAPIRRLVATPPAAMASLREDATKRTCACGGGCPRCAGAAVQPKLLLGDVDDPAEREADAIADRVMRAPANPPSEGSGARQPIVRRLAVGGGGGVALRPAASAGIDAATRGGEPLPASVRTFFEPRFGHDLSHVRLHTHGSAARAAACIGARAFTFGHGIAFAEGEYAPSTDGGRRLLAHELAHVFQQAPDVIRRDARSDVTDLSISTQFAADLAVDELTDLIAYLESLATNQTSSGPTDEVIEHNLGVLRAVWLERQTSVPTHSEAPPTSPPAPAADAAHEPTPTYTVGDRDDHIPVPGYRGPLRPMKEYTKPFAIDFARQGCYEAAELAEKYMCPTCHVLTQVNPCQFNLRGYVDSYHDNYRIGQFMLGSAVLGVLAPIPMAVAGAFEAGTATGEAITGESSGIRPSNLVMGEFDPGRKLSTTERVLSGAEALLFWTGIGMEMRAARQAAAPALRESRNAYQVTGRSRPSQQYDDPFSGHTYDVSAQSGTPRSQRTAIDADIAEVADYNALKQGGEVGLAGPNGANRGGPDSVTYNPQDGYIYVNDTQTYWTATPSTNKISTAPPKWSTEARQAASQADLGDPILENAIRDAANANRIRRRNHTPRRVEPPASGGGPYVDIGEGL